MESPNNGHIGDWSFVRRELSASRRLLKYVLVLHVWQIHSIAYNNNNIILCKHSADKASHLLSTVETGYFNTYFARKMC